MIGKRIRELRDKKDITQRELAQYLGLTPKMVSFYENEERFPPHDIIVKLSSYFNVSSDYLLGLTDVESTIGFCKVGFLSIFHYNNSPHKNIYIPYYIKPLQIKKDQEISWSN